MQVFSISRKYLVAEETYDLNLPTVQPANSFVTIFIYICTVPVNFTVSYYYIPCDILNIPKKLKANYSSFFDNILKL